jgi:hypothetical protein
MKVELPTVVESGQEQSSHEEPPKLFILNKIVKTEAELWKKQKIA